MNNKGFILLLIVATLMVFGVIAENTRSVTDPVETEMTIDTTEIKNKIQRAGIIPREAMHWKEL